MLHVHFGFFPLMGLPNLIATRQVNSPVSAEGADYDCTTAAACVHLTLSNVLYNLTGSLFQHHVWSCQLRSSLCHPVSRWGHISGTLFQLRKGWFLVGAMFLDQPEDSNAGRNGFEFLEETREMQAVVWVLCHSCCRCRVDVFSACCPFPHPRGSWLGRHLCAISLGKHKMLLQLPGKQALAPMRSTR